MLDRPMPSPVAVPAPVTIAETGPRARLIFRARNADAVAAAEQALGFDLPTTACRFVSRGPHRAMWLGPDEWMLLAEGADEAAALPLKVRSATAWTVCSLVDVGSRSLTLAVDGPAAATVLAAGNPLDLAEAAFPVGACTRTVFAKCEIILARVGPERFEIDVWRSFAPYVRGLLDIAAAEHR